ncbi:MAG: DUF1858 domain-containing protein [Bacteroidales bacterium]|nr:DUF1858 domain-containing protein [Bacteroidales bacterium]
MEETKLIISPKTRVLALIEAYPQLEELLINYVPVFEKLKNPVLRKTVAKVATLQQAASIGKIKTEELVNVLRNAVGQDSATIEGDESFNTIKPAWFSEEKIVGKSDIRPMLDAGEQPVNLVLTELNKMKSGDIYKVISPFLPAPLIDKSLSINMQHWVNHENDELVLVYFYKE